MKNQLVMKASWLWRSLWVGALLVAAVPLVSAADDVALVQQALKLRHFYYGEVDGNFDAATLGALRRFQFRNGLPGTGEMDNATVEMLTGAPLLRTSANPSIATQSERTPEFARPVQKEGDRAAMSAAGKADQRADRKVDQQPAFSAGVETREQRPVPQAAHTESVQSWASQHRAPLENRVEVRRAIPITLADPVDRSEASPEVETTVAAHFTGQDGHVYTYYRKTRATTPEASESPALPPSLSYGAGGTAFSFSQELSDAGANPGGNFARR